MQQPKRFQAPTLAEAYEQVRNDLGDGAVILSTRKAFAPGLFGQPGRQFVEVVARVPEDSGDAVPLRATLEQDRAAHDLVRAVAEATAALSAVAGPFAGTRQPAPLEDALAAGHGEASDVVLEQARGRASGSAVAGQLGQQLEQMRGMLEQLLEDRRDARVDAGPAGLRVMKDHLVRHGMPAALAGAVLAEVDARPTEEAALASAVERRLAAKLPPAVALPTLRNTSRSRAIFVVGPSGAGKTTMAVRLALQLQRQELNVVIAGTDVNRAGAPQQLLAFGAATGLEVRLCYAPDELAEVLADAEVDVVIVDTPGHNGLRRDRMAELDSFLQAARQRLVLLAVPATMKGADLAETVSAYSATGIDGLVLTRCDETSHYGALAGVSVEASIGVAFSTHSDQVSEAAVPGDNLALAAAVVRATWDPAQPAPAAAPTPAPRRRLARAG
ncbi:MAG: hypothetical protein M0R73_05790 [Dehalococcoidia bacterium]|nr:hypothetical protein [Dehalococcoidia bacterium]